MDADDEGLAMSGADVEVEVEIETLGVATPDLETPAFRKPDRGPDIEPDIDAFDLLVAVAKHKKPIAWASLSAGFLALMLSLLLPNMYTATTRILPPQQPQSMASAMLGQLGPLASLAGHDLGLKNPNDVYIAMLESRSAGDALIRRFDLMRRYRSRSMDKTREELAERTSVINGKDGIISILYEDEEPRRAADISNAYVEELSKISTTLAITEAGQRRLFYENQLRLAKEQLSNAEVALRVTQESTGLIEPGAQAKAIIESVAGLRAQIAVKEVQLKAMSVFATDVNPDSVRTQREIAGLRGQLSQLERDTGAQPKGDLQVATEKVPEAGMAYLRGYRDMKYHETIFELIAKQYEMAKMDEARDVAVIQVLDPAIPPEKKSRPNRLSMVLMGVFGTALTAMLVAILRELPLLSPGQQAQWRRVKSYLAAR